MPAVSVLVRGILPVVLVVLVVGSGAFVLSSSVTVVVDGEARTTRTFAADVDTVLDRVGVTLGPADRVEPPPHTPVEDGLRVVVTRAKTVEVQIEDEPPQRVTAVADTVADVLGAAGLADLLDREARIDPAPEGAVTDGDRVEIVFPVAVTIRADGMERHLDTYASTIAGALEDAEVEVGARDLVTPPPSHLLERSTVVTVRRVEVATDAVEMALEHDEVRLETEDLVRGEARLHTEGRDGVRRETYEVTRVEGQETQRELVAEEVVLEPVDRVVLVGVGPGPVEEAQHVLADLGYPVGPVDGIDGPQTRRALCAWRRLEGHDVSRAGLQPGELDALQATVGLPQADTSDRAVVVDRTCQALYVRQDGRWQQVHAASTGADGLPRPGSYRIQRTRAGWHTSTLYPAPEPNMYNSLYFHGTIAIHGSGHVPPRPASAGCVRVIPDAADQLYATLRVGDPVHVIGSY